jgi:hypothetical protein
MGTDATPIEMRLILHFRLWTTAVYPVGPVAASQTRPFTLNVWIRVVQQTGDS